MSANKLNDEKGNPPLLNSGNPMAVAPVVLSPDIKGVSPGLSQLVPTSEGQPAIAVALNEGQPAIAVALNEGQPAIAVALNEEGQPVDPATLVAVAESLYEEPNPGDLEPMKVWDGTAEELLAEDARLTAVTTDVENKIVDSKAWEAGADAILDIVSEADSDEGGQRIYANEFALSLCPLRTFSLLLARFPFYYTKNEFSYFEFFYRFSSPSSFSFVVMSVFHLLLFLISAINLFGILLNAPKIPDGVHGVTDNEKWTVRAEELFVFHRNAAPLIIFFCSLIHIMIGNFHIFNRRVYIASYFTFWTEALQTTKLHAARGVFKFMAVIIFTQLLFMVIFTFFAITRWIPITQGAPGLLVILIFRIFKPDIHSNFLFHFLTYGASITFFYILICGKLYVFLFLFMCKLLGNSFQQWNHRLDIVLNRSDDFIVRGNRLGKRTGFHELFQDHVVLLDLIEGSDVLFSETMESFFTCEVGSLCFQLYYVIRSLTEKDEFQEARRLDLGFMSLYLLNTIIIISLLSNAISSVSSETMDGLEILRRKGFFGRKSPEELYFLLSLYTSFNGHFETAISGSGYYVLNKGFILTFAGSFLVYMVILLQFSPALQFTDPALGEQISNVTRLILQVENPRKISFLDFEIGFFSMDIDEYHIYNQTEWPTFT